MRHDEQLKLAVVAIKNQDQEFVGTGFFIGKDGTILTCAHVVDAARLKDDPQRKYWIEFEDGYYSAECVFFPQAYEELDIAILRLDEGQLPESAILLPLGKWEAESPVDREFETFGFRSHAEFAGLYADGMVRGRVSTRVQSRVDLLQLSSFAQGREEIRPGMSGSPVFYKATKRIVGIVTTRYMYRPVDEKYKLEWPNEIIPLAIPIDQITDQWAPLEYRFRDQDLLDQLEANLKKWFTDWGFSRMCQDLPDLFEFGEECSHLDAKGNPHGYLLDHINKNDNLYKFIYWLRRNYPDLPVEDLYSSISYYPFYNRDAEIQQIMDESTQYITIDAPPGYGKTALLKEVELRHLKNGWFCLYVETPKTPANCQGIGTEIQRKLGKAGLVNASTNDDGIGASLGELLAATKLEFDKTKKIIQFDTDKRGVLLLIDNLERLDEENFSSLHDTFIPAIQKSLSEKNIGKFKVLFSGRYLGTRYNKYKEIYVSVNALKPFDLDVIEKTLKENTPDQQTANMSLRAAYLMHLTGGHPGCMAEIMSKMKFTWPPDLFFTEYANVHKKIVLSVSEEVSRLIPDNLRSTFEILSVFRKYNAKLLDLIIHKTRIQVKEGDRSIHVLKRLSSTHLVSFKNGFHQDEIIRRILAINMRYENPERFLDLLKIAKAVYQESMSGLSRHIHTIVLEILFIELYLGYYGQTIEEASLEERQKLKENFFSSEGILTRQLDNLKMQDDPYDILQEFQNTFERDWEFIFVLNYFLRGEIYDSTPYQRMQEHIVDVINSL